MPDLPLTYVEIVWHVGIEEGRAADADTVGRAVKRYRLPRRHTKHQQPQHARAENHTPLPINNTLGRLHRNWRSTHSWPR